MNISDEALAAAADAIYDNHFCYGLNMAGAEGMARAALEAAAPHLMAGAWDEGHDAGWTDCLLDLENGGAKKTKNPHTRNPARCPACRMGLVTHDERDPHCLGYRKPTDV